MYILCFILLNMLLVCNYVHLKKFWKISDFPDSNRKFHKEPTPLLGGLIIYINFLLFFIISIFDNSLLDKSLFYSTTDYYLFFAIASLFFFLGIIDDKYHLNANTKLILMTLFIFINIFYDNQLTFEELRFSFLLIKLNLYNIGLIIPLLCFLLFINSLNMLDGINGQVGAYTIFIFIILSFHHELHLLISIFILSIVFFLYLNFKSKSFLGDGGTLFLGYVISYFFIKSYNSHLFGYVEEIFFIMCIPGYELLRLAIMRICKKKHPFSPDRNHIHHIIIAKISLIKTFFLMQFVLVCPYFAYMLSKNFLLSFLFSLTCYALTINYFSKKI